MQLVSSLVVQSATETPTDRLIERLSLHKLKKSVAWYLRLFEFLKRKRAGFRAKDLVKGASPDISVMELKSVELKVAIYEQRRYLSNLILALKNGNRLSCKVYSRFITKLNPFISYKLCEKEEGWERLRSAQTLDTRSFCQRIPILQNW